MHDIEKWKADRLGCANLAEEAVDLAGEIAGLRGELLGGAEHLAGGGAGVVGGLLHAGDVGIDLLGAARGFLHAAGDFLGRRALLLDRGCDRGSDLVDLGDDVDDVLDRCDGLVGGRLDRRDLLGIRPKKTLGFLAFFLGTITHTYPK